MSVRAKFVVSEIRITQGGRQVPQENGGWVWEPCEQRTVIANPVYGNGDPSHENTKFWEASPSGSLELAVINPAVWPFWQGGNEC